MSQLFSGKDKPPQKRDIQSMLQNASKKLSLLRKREYGKAGREMVTSQQRDIQSVLQNASKKLSLLRKRGNARERCLRQREVYLPQGVPLGRQSREGDGSRHYTPSATTLLVPLRQWDNFKQCHAGSKENLKPPTDSYYICIVAS